MDKRSKDGELMPPPPLPPAAGSTSAAGTCRIQEPCAKLITKDVVFAYIVFRILEQTDIAIHRHFNIAKAESIICQPTMQAIDTTRIWISRLPDFKQNVDIMKIVIKPKEKPKLMRNVYIGKLSSMFFKDCGPLTSRHLSWCKVVMALEATAQVAITAGQVDRFLRITELGEWCTLYFKSFHIDDWIHTQGGWERIKQSITSEMNEYARIEKLRDEMGGAEADTEAEDTDTEPFYPVEPESFYPDVNFC